MRADRLVLSAFVPRLLAVLLAGLAIYGAVEAVDLANEPGSGGVGALVRYPLRLPLGLVLVSPVALLLGGCWTGLHLLRTGQLVGLAAAGLSPRRGLRALLGAGVVWAGLVWGLAAEVAPRSLVAWSGHGGAEQAQAWPRWITGGEHVLYRLGSPSGEGGYRDVLALTTDGEGRVESWVEAEEAEPDRGQEGRWVLRRAVVRRAGQPLRRVELLAAPGALVALGAEGGQGTRPELLTATALGGAWRRARLTGADPAPLEAELGLRGALAAACPLCVALGALAGVVLGRRPGLATGAAALAGLGYWSVLSTLWALAAAGAMPGHAVAWAPAAAAGALTAWLWARWLR